MKKLLSASWILILSLLAVSCSKSNSDTANSANNSVAADSTKNPSSALISGKWIISSYIQKTEDKTSQFSGYLFIFASGGNLTATKDNSTIQGTWSYTPSAVGYYGGPPSKASMTLNFGTNSQFIRLSRIWNVVSTSDINISLLNPEPVDDEHLIFSKQ